MAKGFKTGGGSRKGVPNKATKELKDLIEGALHDLGGKKWLMKAARRNPGAFMSLIGKMLPRDVTVEKKGTDLADLLREVVERNRKMGYIPGRGKVEATSPSSIELQPASES